MTIQGDWHTTLHFSEIFRFIFTRKRFKTDTAVLTMERQSLSAFLAVRSTCFSIRIPVLFIHPDLLRF